MKKFIFIFLTGLLLLTLFVGSASAMGGSGTQADPWTINSLADLKLLSGTGYSAYAGTDKYFTMTADITDDGSFTTIGNSAYHFNGHFSGQNHTIYNLHTGLFFALSKCTIKDITFENVLVNGGVLTNQTGTYATVINAFIDNVDVINSRYNVTTAQAILFYRFGGGYSDATLTTVKNCDFINLKIGGGAMGLFGYPYQLEDLLVENCHVKNCILSDGGSFLGNARTDSSGSHKFEYKDCTVDNCYINGSPFMTSINNGFRELRNMTNCHVTNCTIRGGGGIFSVAQYDVKFQMVLENVTVKNCSIMASTSCNGIGNIDGVTAGYITYKNCNVENVNLQGETTYALSNPSKFTNQNSTSSGITTDSNVLLRWVSGATLTSDTSQEFPKAIGETVTFTATGQQGAAIYLDSSGNLKNGYDFADYGGGGTQVGDNPFTAKYSTEGTKTVWCSLTGWNGMSSFYAGSIWAYAYIKIPFILENFTTNPSSSSYSPTNVSVSLTALTSGGTPTSYVWSYTTDPSPSASSSWTNIGTTSTNTTTFTPTTVGTYTFRVVASMTGASVDSLDVPLKPYLQIFVSLSGDGTSSNPYKVGSDADLQNWSTYNTYYNDKYMSITQDFVPTVTVNKFEGHLEGNNHVLSQGQKSLFYTLNATVQNLTLSKFINKGYYGILAEYGSASVSNVTVEESYVQRSNIVGGIIGRANGSTFTNCTVNHVTIKATASTGVAGGITGEGNVTVNNCRVLNSDILGATTYGVCP